MANALPHGPEAPLLEHRTMKNKYVIHPRVLAWMTRNLPIEDKKAMECANKGKALWMLFVSSVLLLITFTSAPFVLHNSSAFPVIITLFFVYEPVAIYCAVKHFKQMKRRQSLWKDLHQRADTFCNEFAISKSDFPSLRYDKIVNIVQDRLTLCAFDILRASDMLVDDYAREIMSQRFDFAKEFLMPSFHESRGYMLFFDRALALEKSAFDPVI